MSKQQQQRTPFSKGVLKLGCFAAFVVLIVDVPWPRVQLLGQSYSMALCLFAFFLLIAFFGLVLGGVEVAAAHTGKRRAALAAAAEPVADESSSSPVGETVMPKA